MARQMVVIPKNDEGLSAPESETIRGMFASVSGRYDLLNRLLSFGRDRRWRQTAVKASLEPGMTRVLDVCAGTGDLSLEYLEAMGAGAQVILTDFCFEMLELAREKIHAKSLHHCAKICQADALQLPFPDDSFDLACVAFGIRNVNDLEGCLLEMRRVIREGGKIVILEFYRPENRLFRFFYYLYFLHILPVIGRWVSGSRLDAYGYLPRSVIEFSSAGGLAEKMEAIGLNNVIIQPLMFGAVNLHIGKK